jgi:hypothetical protein
MTQDFIPFEERLRATFEAAIAEPPRWHRRISRRLLVVGALATLLIAGPAYAIVQQSFMTPRQEVLDEEGGGIFLPETFQVLRTVENPPGIIWTAVTYETTELGSCLDVYVTLKGAEKPQGAGGACLDPSDSVTDDLSNTGWGVTRIDDQLIRTAEGRVGPTVAKVQATLTNGETVEDEPVNTFWILIATDDANFVQVDALDSSGHIVASITPT